MSFSQSIETPLTQKNTAILSGELSVKNGIGSGAINLAFKRLMTSMSWIEAELSAGNWPAFTLRGYKKLSRKLHFNCDVPLKFTSKGIEPSIAGCK
jgi:DnaJ family protein C protein 11